MLQNHCFSHVDAEHLLALISAGAEMRRDDDYMRQILLDMEASPNWQFEGSSGVMAPDDQARKRAYHIGLLLDGGLLTKLDPNGHGVRMTSQGHDFLEVTRQSDAWNAVKAASRKLGGATASMMLRIGEAYAVQRLREMGVPI